LEGYLYRGIGRTYVSLPGRAGGLPVLIKINRIIYVTNEKQLMMQST